MHVRLQIEDVLTRWLADSLLVIGYRNVRNKRLDSASKSAELLRDYFKLKKESEALYRQIKLRKDHDILFHFTSLLQQILSLMHVRTQLSMLREKRELQQKYGKYLQCLQA